jgi:predicted ATPase/class 3 adenylate cyclase
VSTSGDLPTGTVTFLFTDVEGSTRLNQRHGNEAYGRLLERHQAALRAAFAGADGREVSTEGDSFFVAFTSAVEAVRAAVDGQRRLSALDWPPEGELRVRMGLHTGDGHLAGDNYTSIDVSRAARIEAAAHGGQVLLSEVSAALVAGGLPAGVRLVDVGEHRLKDLRPERLSQLEIEGLRSTFPPIRSLDARPNNLPSQLTSFVGRELELTEAGKLLQSTRLLTLTGPGGTGKTRLGLQLAAGAAHAFPDGLFFVALEPIRDPSLVATRIAAAVGIVETGLRPAVDVLGDWLGERRVLLLLDNFEQVLGAAPVVAELLRTAPELKVIVTSRAALHVSGEQEYPVPGLPAPPDLARLSAVERQQLPAGLRNLDIESFERYEAIRLFVSRAQAVRPDFGLTTENAPQIAAICARLHGMPLAIELAAARIRILDPAAILARLERQLQLLASGARDLPPRQQTLRGAIAWSYDILEPGLQRLLERLSVFVAGCDLAGAEAVCGPADEIGVDVLDGLEALVDHSLVRCEDADGERRFRLLDTIREFAAERLEARGEAEEILRRHGDVYCSLAHEAASLLSGEHQRSLMERLDREHDNIRAVLDRAVRASDGAVAIPLAFAMWRFWQKRGHLDEAHRRLEVIATQPWAREDPRRWARLAEARGGVGYWRADGAAMRDGYEEALRVWRELGDPEEIANALYNSAFRFTTPFEGEDTDHDGEGARRLEEARQLFTSITDNRGLANTLWAMGTYYYFRNEQRAGVDHFREALSLFERTGDRTMEAWALHMLGSGLLRLGDAAEARRICRDAIRQFHTTGDTSGVTLSLDDLSAVAVAEGDLPRAARLRGAARSLTAATGVGLAQFIEESFEQGIRPSVRTTAISREDLERYGAEGAAMTLDEAVAYALDVPVESLGDHRHDALDVR